MMTTSEYRTWAAANNLSVGNMGAVKAIDFTEAERYVADFPRCRHGFATAAHIDVLEWDWHDGDKSAEAKIAGRKLISDAGYQSDNGVWRKAGFVATLTVGNGRGDITVMRDGEWVAMQDDSPESLQYGR